MAISIEARVRKDGLKKTRATLRPASVPPCPSALNLSARSIRAVSSSREKSAVLKKSLPFRFMLSCHFQGRTRPPRSQANTEQLFEEEVNLGPSKGKRRQQPQDARVVCQARDDLSFEEPRLDRFRAASPEFNPHQIAQPSHLFDIGVPRELRAQVLRVHAHVLKQALID